MSRLFRRRLQRALDNVPEAPPDLSSLSPDQQVLWAVRLLGLKALLQGATKGRATTEPAAGAAPKEKCEPEPQAKATQSTPAVSSPPPAKPRRREAWEPDPAAIPPQNQYWEELCRWRFRGPNEPYDDEPSEADELDELIYGESS
jgi:hypothetical protein